MKFYHAVPNDFEGSQLVPLNRMHTPRPDLYTVYAKKYEGREPVKERKIPLLGCTWGDVVQLLPVHPQQVYELQVQLGLIPNVPPYKFFEIDSKELDVDNTVVFFKDAAGEENIRYEWLKEVNPKEIDVVPPATRAYYESLVGSGELPFNYQFIPHIMHKGSIDISDASKVTLHEKGKTI